MKNGWKRICSDQNSFYQLLSAPQPDGTEEYFIRQSDFDGVPQREFAVPHLQQSMQNQFISYFDCAANGTFLFRSGMGQFKVYQLRENQLEELYFGKLSDGDNETAPQPFIGSVNLADGKLHPSEAFPYVYLDIRNKEGHQTLGIFNPMENKMYHLDFGIDESSYESAFSVNRRGDALIHCLHCITGKFQHCFVSAEDILSQMQPCLFPDTGAK